MAFGLQAGATPISDDDWAAGRTDDGADASHQDDPAGDAGRRLETQPVVAFLSEHADGAFTKREIRRGVDFGTDVRPGTDGDVLAPLQDELIGVAGGVLASSVLRGTVDEALDELVEEGTVVSKAIADETGTTTYYRLNVDDRGG